MATKIQILVDQYFHRWDTAEGELWFVLRAYVSNLPDFAHWAAHPDALTGADGQPYEFEFPRAGACGVLYPINLPQSISIWHAVSDGLNAPLWTVYDRQTRARLKLGALDGADPAAAAPQPYSDRFNAAATAGLGAHGALDVANSLGWQFLSGSEFSAADVTDPFATQGTINPIFYCNGAGPSAQTSLFWLLGLMHRFGTRADLSALKAVQTYDLALVSGMSNTDQPPASQVLARLTLPSPAPSPSQAAEQHFFNAWLDAVPGQAFPATLDATIKIEAIDSVWSKPPRRSFEREAALTPGRLFMRLAQGDRRYTGDDLVQGAVARRVTTTGGRPAGFAYDPTKLVALELRYEDASRAPSPAAVPFRTGLLVSGKLRPYRRFPIPQARLGDGVEARQKQPTVVIFEPNEDCAAMFEAYLRTTPDAVLQPALTAALAAGANPKLNEQPQGKTPVSTWSAEVISTHALDWDGPGRRLRLLATPAGGVGVEPGESMGLTAADLSFFLPGPDSADLTRVEDYQAQVQLPPDPDDPKGPTKTEVHQFWTGFWRSSASAVAAFNVVDLDLSAVPAAARGALHLVGVYCNDFDFEQGLSATQVEGLMTVTTSSESQVGTAAQQAGLADPAGEGPQRAYAEDKLNYTTAHQVDERDNKSDFQAQTGGADCLDVFLAVKQVAPFSKRWPESPRDRTKTPGATQDSDNAVPNVDWKGVRVHVAALYHLAHDQTGASPAPSRHIVVAAKHTYGHLAGAQTFTPPPIPDWPVELLTAAEIRKPPASPAAGPSTPARGDTPVRDSHAFLTVRYDGISADKGQITLVLNPSVLTFAAPMPTATSAADLAEKKTQEDAYAVGLTAWRALAELACGSRLTLQVEPVTFDLFETLEGRPAVAKDWRTGLRTLQRREVLVPQSVRDDLKLWAQSCFDHGPPDEAKSITLDLAAGTNLGRSAAIARVMMRLERPAAMTTKTGGATRVNRRLGTDAARDAVGRDDFRKSNTTLEAAWCASAHDPELEQTAFKHWLTQRQATEDSITPVDLKPLEAMKFVETMRGLREGTDWFPPPEAPDYRGGRIETIITPFGFAPVTPQADLGDNTQKALQALLQAYQDFIDLAYASSRAASDWVNYFARVIQSTPGQQALTAKLVDTLLAPQPDSLSTSVSEAVRNRVKWMAQDDKLPARSEVRAEIKSWLTARPALYADSKAFLLSELRFEGDGDLSPVAGAVYARHIQPWNEKGPGRAEANEPGLAKVVLDLASLRVLDPEGAANKTSGLGFYESLDDAAYDNAFEVDGGGQRVQPFEEVVDPRALAAGGSWKNEIPITPVAEDLGKPIRRVRLASRRLVKAPIMLGARAVPELQTGLLTAGKVVKLAALYTPGAGLFDQGDHRIEAAWASKKKPTFEEEIFSLVYAIEGDEEGENGSNDLFDNDLLSLTPAPLVDASPVEPPVRTPNPLAASLSVLTAQPRGSSEAIAAFEVLLPLLDKIASNFVLAMEAPGEPQEKGFEITSAGAGFKLSVVGQAEDWLRSIAFLRREPTEPIAGGVNRTGGVVVINIATSVWGVRAFTLTQTRNAKTKAYAYSDAFRRGAAQSTPPARRRPTRASHNRPADWVDGAILLKERQISIEALLDKLANAQMHDLDGPLFTPANAKTSGYLLSLSIFEEQFLRPARDGFPAPLPEGRLLMGNFQCRMESLEDLQQIVRFPAPSMAFSVDLHWTAVGGDVPMRLERLFVRLKP